MHLDESTLKKVAALARIAIKDEEVKEYTQGLSNILTWIQQLETVDTSAIGLSLHRIEQAPLRSDEITTTTPVDQILSNAPETAENAFFSVPKVIE